MKNPSLYVFVSSAKEMDKTAAMSLYLDSSEQDQDLDRIIRTVKAEIQSGQAGDVGIQRINIYVIANAHEPKPNAGKFIKIVGERLKTLFSEDFVALHISLLVFLSESNELDAGGIAYEARCRFSYEFLLNLTNQMAFDRIFLLSDRNEYGYVSPENHSNAYNAAMHLPFLPHESSKFEAIMNLMEGESGRVLFASLGFGAVENDEDDLPDVSNAPYLAKILEHELQRGKLNRTLGFEIDSVQIISAITGVAANPATIVNFFGITLKEAENLLYGERICKFFEENYKTQTFNEEEVDTLELSVLAAEDRQISQTLDGISERMRDLSYTLNEKQESPVRAGLFHAIDKIKDAIGECYVIKYELAKLNFEKEKLTARQAKIKPYVEYMYNVVSALKALQSEPKREIPYEALLQQAKENAALNISLLRNDGLLFETHVLGDPVSPCVLRLVGGFALEDLTRFKAMQAHKDYLP